ncbi:hypothetical protein CCACVL1_13571 [Corchorus capsularis]|uniref:Pentatricopeptide repeat-containing protein n=1 Tax=Corchorus capsularis TaxID=210143 RepID=A0A1R3IAI8_COCAP|nr:hypothetical protein CCACVL1_13571 [Corchorus capsularis]
MKKLTQILSRHELSSIKALLTQSLLPQALKISLSPHSPLLTDQIYSHFIKSGHSLDPILSTTLISHFSRHADLSRAVSFFLDTQKSDTITFNSLISGFARFGQTRPAFQLFNELGRLGLKPDVFTLSGLVKSCEGLEENVIAHGVCLRLGFGNGAFVASGLIENYAKSGDLVSAEKSFKECLEVDHVALTAMICGYFWNGEFEKGEEMLSLGKQIQAVCQKEGLLEVVFVGNALISMYGKCGEMDDARFENGGGDVVVPIGHPPTKD